MEAKALKLFILIVFFFKGSIFAQTPELIFQSAFSDLYSSLKIDSNTVYDKNLKINYQQLYQKLEIGYTDITNFQQGSTSQSDILVFEVKDLKIISKNESDIVSLKQLIIENQRMISRLFFGYEKYGADSAKCVKYYNIFSEFINQNNLTEAYNSWTILFNEFPMISKNIYIKGNDIITSKIDECGKSGNEVEELLWIDTLFLLYDRRLVFFGDEGKYGRGYVLGKKGVDLIKYRTNTHYLEAYNILCESINLQKNESEIAVILNAMKASYAVFLYKKINCDSLINNYLTYSNILENQQKTAVENGETKKAENIITVSTANDKYLFKSNCLDCEKIEIIFKNKITKSPENTELLNDIQKYLVDSKCDTSLFYENIYEKLYQTQPSEILAYKLAKIKLIKSNFEEASAYYEKAINLCNTDTTKAKYYYEAAIIYNERNLLTNAKEYCYKSIDLNKNSGTVYLVLANIYSKVAGTCGNDEFEHQTIYWIIVDKLNLAKEIDHSLEEKVNSLISVYSARYPDKNTGLSKGIKEGQNYTPDCWINETTTARYN